MNTNKLTAAAMAAALMTGAIAAPAAMAQSDRQKDKNTNRSLGIGLGGAALLEALRGKGTNALILGAGAAYAGKKYEDARKAQDKETRDSVALQTNLDTVDVMVNDQRVSFADQKPVVIDGRAYVPLRGVLERLGATVKWDPSAKLVTAVDEGKTVRLPSNGPATVNGKEVNLDSPAFVQNGRVYVPLRFFAETFDAQVAYDKDSNVVRITDNGKSS